MTFNSFPFLIFYPIVAVLYFLLPRRFKWPMLLIASYYFYAYYQADLLFLIIGTTFVSWLSSFVIERTGSKLVRRFMLTLTLAVCLGVLFFYKYFNFLSESATGLVNLFGSSLSPFYLELILPVGISFYTFQTLSYVIDVYRGDIKTEKNFFFYALFVSFFPQLVAGPIERPGNLIPQLKATHRFNKSDFSEGAKYMLVGFIKKIVIADLVSVYVNSVYNSVETATALGVIIATLLFSVQIYCDFSGYTDIATGCARIMGIRLMKNFDRPYSATSIKEFWSRWHISLSGWFKDYLYIPLGGSRCKKPRALLNIFIVFLVSGLWHGAAFTFVIWGALHGIYRIVGSLTVKGRDKLVAKIGLSPDGGFIKGVRRLLTFLLVSFAWLFFRANSVADAFTLLARLFSGWGNIGDTLSYMGLGAIEIATVIVSVLLLILLDRMHAYDAEASQSDFMVKRGAYLVFLWVIILAWALLLSSDMESSFIYFQF